MQFNFGSVISKSHTINATFISVKTVIIVYKFCKTGTCHESRNLDIPQKFFTVLGLLKIYLIMLRNLKFV